MADSQIVFFFKGKVHVVSKTNKQNRWPLHILLAVVLYIGTFLSVYTGYTCVSQGPGLPLLLLLKCAAVGES